MFRDEETALRARNEALERELGEARDELAAARSRLEAVDPLEKERERLAERVKELELSLALRPPSPPSQPSAGTNWGTNWGPLAAASIAMAVAGAVGFALLQSPAGPTTDARGLPTGPAPGRDAPPSLGMVDLDRTPMPAPIDAQARGVAAAPDGCRGYLPLAPDVVLRSSRPARLVLDAVAVPSGDLVMLIRDPAGQLSCDDDSGGSLNPRVTARVPAGDTRVWVGTYGEGSAISYQLRVASIAEELGEAQTPVLGTLAATEPETTGSWDGTASGWADASAIQPGCVGFLPPRPTLDVTLTARSAVELDASGPQDLVLLARTADGAVSCDDDSGPASAPRLAAVFEPGTVRVWVGTFSHGPDPTPMHLTARISALGGDASPLVGSWPLAAGTPRTLSGTSAGRLSPSVLGAPCSGGLVELRPHAVLELADTADVEIDLSSDAPPFAVLEHPGGRFECVAERAVHATWAAGAHRIFVGVEDDATPAPFTLTATATPPSLEPWRP